MWDKRRKEILEAFNEAPDIVHAFVDEIISQEKEMIREFTIELFDKTSCQNYCELCAEDKKIINKLLSKRGIEEI
jgi:predicted transcriptional regulator